VEYAINAPWSKHQYNAISPPFDSLQGRAISDRGKIQRAAAETSPAKDIPEPA